MAAVSVIIATYNRSNVLVHTLRSLLRSTDTDWEALVIGDACTDDTAEVVASFDDPRITFTNLPRNIGEQSGPDNEGLRRATGRYIAHLDHDDLWFPDHLERAVGALRDTGVVLDATSRVGRRGGRLAACARVPQRPVAGPTFSVRTARAGTAG